MKKVIVLLSGGIDSTTAFYHAREESDLVAGVSFDYGSRHNEKELAEAAYHCAKLGVPHEVIKLAFVETLFSSALLKGQETIPDGHYEAETMKATVVPFRNGIMLSVAAGFAESIGARGVVIGAHAGDHAIYPDCRETFMNFMAKAIKVGTYAEIELLCPFISMTKSEIVRRGQELKVDFIHTWSCYKGEEIHCGTCGTCIERREAFLLACIQDPTVYLSHAALPAKPVAC